MCGIVGIRRFDARPVAVELLRAMAAQVAHRGPDDDGFWTDGTVGFGHRRLAIIDVSGSPQPMASVDADLHLTFNGEILNYAELRAGCEYPYRTHGDTEVLLALHRRDGIRSVEQLRGQFAYGLFDGDDLWLVRDRLGVLPLYYYRDDRMLAFASEIKALLPALPRHAEVDEASLDAYLAQRSVPAPYTMFEGIRKVRPGHWLRVGRDGRTEESAYWTQPTGVADEVDDRDAVLRVEVALHQAVERALVADVPIGVLLSGGVDSSLITALAAEHRPDTRLATFSAGFGDHRHDETVQAREVSRRFGTEHHELILDPNTFSQRWRELSWYRDAPLSEPADIAVFELATAASSSVKVLLSGEGADELFGGYPKYLFARWSGLPDVLPDGIRRSILETAARAMPAKGTRARIAMRALSEPTEAERLAAWFAPFLPSERRELLAGITARPTVAPPLVGPDPVARMLAHDCGAWLEGNLLERGDRMAMAASVETRPPFLDTELVHLAFALPSRMKVRRTTRKWVLKEVARRHLPAHIVDRPKVGFRVPLDTWFRRRLGEMAQDLLLDPSSFAASVLDPAAVRRLLDSHARGRRDESIRIWTLVSLEIWHDAYFGPSAIYRAPIEGQHEITVDDRPG